MALLPEDNMSSQHAAGVSPHVCSTLREGLTIRRICVTQELKNKLVIGRIRYRNDSGTAH